MTGAGADADRPREPVRRGTEPIVRKRSLRDIPHRARGRWKFRSRRIRFWNILVAAAVGVLLLGGLSYLAWDAKGRTTDPNDWYEIGRAVVFAFAAIGAVPAGYIAFRRQQTLESQHELDRQNHDLDRDKLELDERKEEQRQLELHLANERADYNDARADAAARRARFTEASNQLGSDKAAIRLAGVYAMAQLADDWGTNLGARQQCIDVLCAYVRLPFPGVEHSIGQPAGEPLPGKFEPDPAEVRVRETVVGVISDHFRGATPVAWSGASLDFTGARFPGPAEYDFSGTRFLDASVTFQNAQFDGGKVSFDLIQLDGALKFNGAVLSGGAISFAFANINGLVDFGSVNIGGDAKLSFGAATVHGGNLSFGGAVVSEKGAITFVETEIDGGKIDCEGVICAGSGKVILSNLLCTGGGHMVLDDRQLKAGTFNMILSAEGFDPLWPTGGPEEEPAE